MSQVRNGKAKLPRRPSSEDLEAPLTDSAAGSPSSSGRLERRTLPSSSGGVYLSEVQLNQVRLRTAHSALFNSCAGKLSIAWPDEATSVRMCSIKVRCVIGCACAAHDFQYQLVAHCAKKECPGWGSFSDEDLASEAQKIGHWLLPCFTPTPLYPARTIARLRRQKGAGHAAASASLADFTFLLLISFLSRYVRPLYISAWTEALTPACRKNSSVGLLHGGIPVQVDATIRRSPSKGCSLAIC